LYDALQLGDEGMDADAERGQDHCFPAAEESGGGAPDSEDPKAHYVYFGVDDATYGQPELADELGNSYVEVLISRPLAKCFLDDRQMQPDETAVLKITTGHKTAVIQRETDLLTPEELAQHTDLVAAAILEELQIWHGHSCFQRQWKAQAYNVMDSRFVAKWKKTLGKDGKMTRIIRMRLALRGFKDKEADRLASHAATTSRLSQRIINSETAGHPNFVTVSIDISKAFLQGLTYDELADLTGEPRRHVAFTLPKGAAAQLRKIAGYEDFCEYREVLECTKPGTGCKDAPRAFSLKLAKVTRSTTLQMHPTVMDPELEIQHDGTKLTAALGKHVDDVKITGEPKSVQNIVDAVERVFGKITSS
jgi:hypothetical protein